MVKASLWIGVFSLLAAAQPSAARADGFFTKPRTVKVYTTAAGTGHRLSVTDAPRFFGFPQPGDMQPCVFVDPSKAFQTLIGIGGALTDAAAEVFAKLPKDGQRELLRAYYDAEKGIGYTVARTNIHSCDFSSESYTYVAPGDKDLKTFSIEHDRKYRIPLIKQAMAAAGGRLTLFASPWSPPAWMKDTGSMLHGGHLLPQFFQTWAEYVARFVRAYEKEGIPVWGLTVQNEPMADTKWESCIYTAEQERDFLRDHLGPTLAKEGLADKKIMIWDHNRDLIYQRVSVILGDPQAAKYVWGIGFHWYEDWAGGEKQYVNIQRVAEAFPGKPLFHTEGCNGPFDMKRIDEWGWGEVYGRSMINDFNNGAVGWTDWNILLDDQGGPNHVGNYCFAPIHAESKTGRLHYMNSYYYIGHFSKFIRPGARRVSSVSSKERLLTTAFLNSDGKLAVVVMNQGDQEIPYHLWIEGQAAAVTSPAHSIQTLVVE